MWLLLACVLFTGVIKEGYTLPSRLALQTKDANLGIIGGDDAKIESFPYQVALTYVDSFKCGGSILNENFVLTAAHCLYYVQSDWHVRVRAGSTLRTSGGQYPHAKKVMYDSRFTMKNLRYDVGLIKLETPLVLGPAVQPVQLVAVGAEPQVGSSITLSGWGVVQEGNKTPPLGLRTTQVQTVRRWTCSLSYVLMAKITDAMFCAAAQGKDTCQGDSGGPAVDENGRQVGIVSFGNGCANWLFPGVYTNLANAEVRKFIDNSMQSM